MVYTGKKRGAKIKAHIVGYGRTSKGTVVTPKISIRASYETMKQMVIDLLDERIPDWEEAMVELVYYDKEHKITRHNQTMVKRK